MRSYLDFEKPVAELEAKVLELRQLAEKGDAVAIGEELTRLEAKAEKALADLYANLTPWQKTQVARHPQRPHFSDFVTALVDDFTPLSGDRHFGEDAAIVGGFGWFRGRSICVLGQEKGSGTEARIKHNFGMARPEGYRKAVRLMQLADRFRLAARFTGRYHRCVSRRGRGRTRSGRSHRAGDRCFAFAGRAKYRRRSRRRRLRRRHRDRELATAS